MSVHTENVLMLKGEYSAGVIFGGNSCVLNGKEVINNRGFMGSEHVVFLSSSNSIIHEAPGCIAAPLVTMVAVNAINLGAAGQGDAPVPLRLFAPVRLLINTKILTIRDIALLGQPERGFITCKKLTLVKSGEEEPAHFEIIKSWVINEDAEIETVRPS